MSTPATWAATAIIAVLGILGVTVDELPDWMKYTLILIAIGGALLAQITQHKTARIKSANQAAVGVKQAAADKAKHEALLAQVQAVRAGTLTATGLGNGAPPVFQVPTSRPVPPAQ